MWAVTVREQTGSFASSDVAQPSGCWVETFQTVSYTHLDVYKRQTPGIKFALGENPKRAGNPQGGGRGATGAIQVGRYPATRMGVEDVIREAFNDAKAYKAEWDAYDAKVAKGEHPIPPRKDLKLQALKEVLENKRYVHVHCYRADEILMMIRAADDNGFKVRTFQHVLCLLYTSRCV